MVSALLIELTVTQVFIRVSVQVVQAVPINKINLNNLDLSRSLEYLQSIQTLEGQTRSRVQIKQLMQQAYITSKEEASKSATILSILSCHAVWPLLLTTQ